MNGRHGVSPRETISGADGFDIVAIRINQEGSIICRTIIGARSRAAVVAATCFQSCGVKRLDRLVIDCAERDMGAGAFRCS